MSEHNSDSPGLTAPASPHAAICRNCHIQPVLENYPNKLCGDCRQQFIKYPVPRWIWLFAGGIAVVMIFGLVRMPKYLGASVHLARAQKAENAHRYHTAQKELEKVIAAFPNDIEANGRLLIASAYNLDVTTAGKAYEQLQNKDLKDEALLREINASMQFLEQFTPQDTLLAKKVSDIAADPGALEHFFAQADSGGADAAMAGYLVADKLYDMKRYDRSEAILQKVLDKAPGSYIALTLMAATKRNLGDYDGALAICNGLLGRNREDVKVIAAKARTELRRSHDAAARDYAGEALRIDNHDLAALEAMAMVDYYAGHEADGRKILAGIKTAEAGSGDSTVSTRLTKVLDGTEPFR